MNNRNGYGNGGRADARMNPLPGDRFPAYDHGCGMGGPGPMTRPGMGHSGDHGVYPSPGARYDSDLPYEAHGDRTRTQSGEDCMEKRQDCGCNEAHGKSVFEQIQVLDFALYEVVLYLDAYPHDCQALELYHRLLDQRNGLVSRYECETGPLTFRGNKSRTQWDWINEPFPWDIEANQ